MAVDSVSGALYNMGNLKMSGEHDALFDEFVEGISEWSEDGREPASASRSLCFSLDLMEKRRKTNQLEIITRYEKTADAVKGTVGYQDGIYKNFMVFKAYKQEQKILWNGHELHHKKRDVTMYANVTDVKNYHAIYEDNYNCPNCGSVVKIRQLEDGCPYCSTRFKMPDLFPKITSFYTLNMTNIDTRKKIFKICSVLGIAAVDIPMAVLVLLNNEDFFLLKMFMLVFDLLFATFAGYLLGSFLFLFITVIRGMTGLKKSINILSKTKGSKKNLTNRMRQLDRNFSYEYFEGKLASMLQMIVFSDKTQSLSLYVGNDNLSGTEGIVDMVYNAMGLRNFGVVNGVCNVLMEVFVANTYFVNHKIVEKDESFMVNVARRAGATDINGFEVSKVTCHHCGGSFDAMHVRNCPFCSQPYQLIEDDWVVTSVKKRM